MLYHDDYCFFCLTTISAIIDDDDDDDDHDHDGGGGCDDDGSCSFGFLFAPETTPSAPAPIEVDHQRHCGALQRFEGAGRWQKTADVPKMWVI